MTELIDARFSYKSRYRPTGRHKFRGEVLNGFQLIAIDSIIGADAPVAYRVASANPWNNAFDVRLHGGRLWWPLYGDHGPLRAVDFISRTKSDWDSAILVLDPLGRTYDRFAETYEEFFAGKPVKEFESNFDEQARQVRADAARLIFIDGIVHVEAGEPVWFAIFNRETRWSFDLVAGPSSFDRKDSKGSWMPCPDRGARLTAARLGRAFGLDELDKGLAWLGADAVHKTSEVAANGIHGAGPAAGVCATAWAQYLWEVTKIHPGVERYVPALCAARNNFKPPPAGLPYREMLEQFEMIPGDYRKYLPSSLSDEAHLLLERLARATYADDAEMEEALDLINI